MRTFPSDAPKGRRFRLLVARHLREARWRLAGAAVCTLGVAVTDLMRPWPIKVIFDHVLLDKPLPSYLRHLAVLLGSGKALSVVVLAGAIPVIAAVTGAFAFYQVLLTARVGNEIVSSLRRELFGHLQRLTLSFHLKARSGELLTKVASDTAALRDTFTESMLTLGGHVLTVLGVLVIMFALNWKLALVVLATMPVLCWNLFRLYQLTTASARRQRVKEERLATQISEVFTTVSLVQAFGRERYEEERFETQNNAHLGETIRSARLEAVSTRAVEIVGALGTTAVVVVGSLEVLKGRLTPGSVLIFVSYLHALYRPMRNLTKLATRLSKARVSVRRIGDILEVEPDIRDDPDAVEARDLRGEIVLRDVSFHYQPGQPVLRNLSLRIGPGQRYALVGGSGAGKSTLLSLILRLYDPTEGAIAVDGIDLRLYQRESLRASIGVVLQSSLLFGASIRENIAYGKLDASMEEIVEAAKAANAHDFISQLEHGYDTIAGEKGGRLSGGQRQRIAIARAMVRNSSIVLLDEPMTALDGFTEAKVHEALTRLVAGKTCLLVTHDLQAVADADQVLVLEDGDLVDQGRHEELLDRSPHYRELCEIKGRRRERPEPAFGGVQTA